MKSFEVKGGCRLSGEITPQGAKNEALQVICAVLLTQEEVIISNIPDITDVRLLIEMLDDLGVQVIRISTDTYSFKAADVAVDLMYDAAFMEKATRLRGSVMLAGPLLSRYRKSVIPKPGGDKIGRRRMDTHITGFQKLGASVEYDNDGGYFRLSAVSLTGADILLDEPSVTGTANLVMAAVMADGETTIYNAACEPYIEQLCIMLNNMGADISGIRSNLLTIMGVKELKGCRHQILPDMIETGSFLGLAAITGSSLRIKNAGIKHLGIIPEKFRQLGIQFHFEEDDIIVPGQEIYEIQNNVDGSILIINGQY